MKAVPLSVVPLYDQWVTPWHGDSLWFRRQRPNVNRQLLVAPCNIIFPSINAPDIFLDNTHRRGQTGDIYAFLLSPLHFGMFFGIWGNFAMFAYTFQRF